MNKKFREADFFCVKGEEPDEFYHREWDECFDEHMANNFGNETALPVTLVGYSSVKLSKSFAESMAEKFIAELQVADGMAESWWDDYGDIEGDNPPLQHASDEDITRLKSDIAVIVHTALEEHSHVWRCEMVAEHTFNKGEKVKP